MSEEEDYPTAFSHLPYLPIELRNKIMQNAFSEVANDVFNKQIEVQKLREEINERTRWNRMIAHTGRATDQQKQFQELYSYLNRDARNTTDLLNKYIDRKQSLVRDMKVKNELTYKDFTELHDKRTNPFNRRIINPNSLFDGLF